MTIVVLDDAQEDLVTGYHFYEDQSPGLGSYFLDSLFADIDSLLLYREFIGWSMARIALSPRDFHTQSTTGWRVASFGSAQ